MGVVSHAVRMPKQPNLPHSPISILQARSLGIEPARLRSRALQHPFYGVRSLGLNLDDVVDRCRAYAPLMSDAAVFSHSTAARLWGMPLPQALADELHVTVAVPRRAPERAGVIGHQQRLDPAERVTVRGLAVASPAATWAQLAELLTVDDLTAVGEFILTGNPFRKLLPLAEMSEIAAAIAVRSRGPGHRIRVAAVAQVMEGPLSRPETFVRLLVTRCGIPLPVINGDIYDDRGRWVAMPDLKWPQYRVALEYQGDHHRGQKQFRDDIARLEKLVDADWLVVQVTAAELYGDPRVIVERVAARLRSRGWQVRIDLRHLTTFAR